MKYCHNCGKEIRDKTNYCPFCGSSIGVAVDGLAPEETKASYEPSSDEKQQKEQSANQSSSKSLNDLDNLDNDNSSSLNLEASSKEINGTTKKLITAGIVVLTIAIVTVAYFLFKAPDLTNDQILSEFSSSQLVIDNSYATKWGKTDGFSETSRVVESVENTSSGVKTANVILKFQNGVFEINSYFTVTYLLSNGTWTPDEYFEVSRDIKPIAGIEDESIIKNADSLFKYADDGNHKNSKGDRVTLDEIYGDSTEYNVVENSTTADGGSVVLQINTVDGLAKYQGNITAQFTWDGSDWSISSCTVDDAAYEADLSYFVGTWVGTFEDSSLDYFILNSDSNCLGGNATPLTVTIKSVDQSTMSATADIVFCLHNHGQVPSRQESDPNDQTITLTDVLIPIEYENDAYFDLVNQNDQPFYKVSLGINDGVLEGHVRSGARAGSTRTDDFTMVKQ